MKKLSILFTALICFCLPIRAVIVQKLAGKLSLKSDVEKYLEQCGDRLSCKSRDASIFVKYAKSSTPGRWIT